jgi:hypothetical protein
MTPSSSIMARTSFARAQAADGPRARPTSPTDDEPLSRRARALHEQIRRFYEARRQHDGPA